MTDPILAALLADPDPAARLVAADRAAELGDDFAELALRCAVGLDWDGARTLHLTPALTSGPHVAVGAGGGNVWVEVWRPGGGLYRFTLHDRSWRVEVPGRQPGWDCTPPPGLEAAVLAVLRARLAEVRQGVV